MHSLRLLAPVIIDHGVDYAASKFAERLAAGSITLERTTKWITNAIKEVIDSGAVTLDALQSGSPRGFARVHFTAMRLLITHPGNLQIPETLDTVKRHVLDAQHKVERLSQACSLLLVVPAYILQNRTPGTEKIVLSELVQRFVTSLIVDIKNANNIFDTSVPNVLEQVDAFSMLNDPCKEFLRIQIENLKNRDQELRKLM
jgi:hypothetical protein